MDPRMLRVLMQLMGDEEIPAMAGGGYAEDPTLALIGEAGPEAVVPMGGGFAGARRAAMARRRPGMPAAGAGRTDPRHFLDPSTYEAILGGRGDDVAGGAYGPGYLRNKLRRSALQNAYGGRNRAGILARLSGMSAHGQRRGLLDAEIEGSRGVSQALNEADLQGASGYQDYIRNLLSGERESYGGLLMQDRANEEAARQRRADSRNAALGAAGQLAGAGVGYLSGRGRK
jgi:hypothetical protein